MSERDHSISPPPKRRKVSPPQVCTDTIDLTLDDDVEVVDGDDLNNAVKNDSQHGNPIFVKSPIQLNFIPELPDASNKDCLSLGSILGDPLIKECWLFNYLFDVDYIIQQFDPDVRSLVRIKLVHGSWRREDRNRVAIEDACQRYSNVKAIAAYMPEAFGTHHSKMMVLFRHDETAQVIIMTGNLIEQDWSMSQAFWCSPVLSPVTISNQQTFEATADPKAPIGSGRRFKSDLLAYIAAYGDRLRLLHKQLQGYDFTAVRVALIASVPSKLTVSNTNPTQNLWGLPSLSRILKSIPSSSSQRSHIVTQISSVASMGEKWLSETFFPTLSTTATPSSPKPKQTIIFLTPDEIRNSILGYGSGGSIHMKTGSTAQQRQVEFLKPMLCHWSPGPRHPPRSGTDTDPTADERSTTTAKIGRSARHPAAPHIKTYIRFSDDSMRGIDWAMLTSANMSTQAWGMRNPQGEWRVCSYEIGVVVWPGLWEDEDARGGGDSGSSGVGGAIGVGGHRNGGKSIMVPVFNRDTPRAADALIESDDEEGEGNTSKAGRKVVGCRMPYDLPLRPYRLDEMPWCNNQPHAEKDWMGRAWK